MASLCQHGAALAHRSRQGPTHSGPHSLPVALPSLFTRPGGLWIEARSTSQTPPSLLCSVVQISVSTPPDTPHSPSPKPPGPPANHYLSPSSHYWGPPTKYKNPLLQSLNKSSYTWLASLLMKPDCDSRGSPMKWRIFKARIIFYNTE